MPLPWYTIIPRKIFVNKHEVRLEANGAAPSKAIRASRVSVISHLIYAYLIANTLKIDRRFGFSMLCKSFCQTTPTTAKNYAETWPSSIIAYTAVPQYSRIQHVRNCAKWWFTNGLQVHSVGVSLGKINNFAQCVFRKIQLMGFTMSSTLDGWMECCFIIELWSFLLLRIVCEQSAPSPPNQWAFFVEFGRE